MLKNMKNWKVKKKLYVSHGALILMSLIIAIGGAYGMRALHDQMSTLSERAIPNTERVWEMRRNLQNEAAMELQSMLDPDLRQVEGFLKQAEASLDRNDTLFQEFKENASVEPALLDKLNNCLSAQDAPRAAYFRLVKQGTAEADNQAYQVLSKELIPLLNQEADLLQEITDAQHTLNQERIDSVSSLYRLLNLVLFALVLGAILVAYLLIKKLMGTILFPLEQIKTAAQSFRHGDFTAALTCTGEDEFGSTCIAMKESQDILKTVIGDISCVLNEMAQGNFDIRSGCPDQYVGELKAVLDSIRTINAGLSDAMAQLIAGAEQVAAGADQVSIGAQTLAQGATEQASTVEELSATISEISTQSQENAQNSASAMEQALRAGNYVEESARDVKEMVDAMQQISSSSLEIGKIIATIENIAFQTNILALNAAVEAARAGSAGKGFSVVADEVRNLAAKSDEAAKATKELISSSIASVKNGDEIVKRVAESLESTTQAAGQSMQEIELIAKAVEEEAKSIAQVTEGIDQISAVVQTNSATSEESAAASEELSAQAAMVKGVLSRFTLRSDASSAAGFSPSITSSPAQAVESGAVLDDAESDYDLSGNFSKY